MNEVLLLVCWVEVIYAKMCVHNKFFLSPLHEPLLAGVRAVVCLCCGAGAR